MNQWLVMKPIFVATHHFSSSLQQIYLCVVTSFIHIVGKLIGTHFSAIRKDDRKTLEKKFSPKKESRSPLKEEKKKEKEKEQKEPQEPGNDTESHQGCLDSK